jgi:hypothetical protein
MKNIDTLLAELLAGKRTKEETAELLNQGLLSTKDALLDIHREERRGFPEVIFCEGKTSNQVADIFAKLANLHENVLGTRASEADFEATRQLVPEVEYSKSARILKLHRNHEEHGMGEIVIVSAGTSDGPVVDEAYETAKILGNRVTTILDCGVAGLHRILSKQEQLRKAMVIIVVAGMDGALPSVVGGLVARPVIAVPTSVGYGAAFAGVAPLLTMLNSCSAGITVVNIDNGFGAAVAASLINRKSNLG